MLTEVNHFKPKMYTNVGSKNKLSIFQTVCPPRVSQHQVRVRFHFLGMERLTYFSVVNRLTHKVLPSHQMSQQEAEGPLGARQPSAEPVPARPATAE